MKKPTLAALAALLIASTPAVRAVEMCWIFGNKMVLQADMPVRIWGQGAPGEEVSVKFAGQEKKCKAGADGEWATTLDAMPANASGQILRVEASSGSKEFKEVLVGDVWLASGQSNMAQPTVNQSIGGEEESKKPVNPLLRSFPVAYNAWAAEPNTKNFAWEKKVTNWFEWDAHGTKISSVPYYFGSLLQKETGRPIGLIISPVGASNAEAWVSMAAMEKVLEFSEAVARSKAWIANHPKAREAYQAEVAAWEERKKAAEAKGEAFKERKPHDFRADLVPRFWIGALYNARIAPLRNLSIKGVIWYQGENNAAGHGQGARTLESYQKLMETLIASWRQQFQQPELPFLTVQLSMFNWDDFGGRRPRDPNVPGSWSVIREAQERTARTVPKTGMVVSADIGEKADIHPRDKRPVGERLAKLALRDVYGKNVIADGPAYASHKVEGNAIRVQFKNLHGGLEARGESLSGFAIAGADQKFVWADARIDGEEVVVSSAQVPQPVAVRYGYIQYQEVNLFNAAGFPAVPFRTDNWPLNTGGK